MNAPGRVIAVVGPSGVGKDSVMSGIVSACGSLDLVRRTITRAPELGGEEFDSVDDAAFAALQDSGAFCLSWPAHGLNYGIPNDICAKVYSGQSFLVNLSRTVLDAANKIFPHFTVLILTATPDTLARRLAGRGRETMSDIQARLDRSVADIPSHVPQVSVANDGPLADTIDAALVALSLNTPDNSRMEDHTS